MNVVTKAIITIIVNTFMTGPAIDLINYVFKNKAVQITKRQSNSRFKILIAFGNPEKGKSLLRIANSLVKKQRENTNVTALHLTLSDEIHAYTIEDYETEIFKPIIKESQLLQQEVDTMYKAAIDIETDIADLASKGDYDLVLVGIGKSIFEGTLLGKILGFTTRIINPDRLLDKFIGKEGLFENSPFDERTRQIISKTKTPLGILINKDLNEINAVFVPVLSTDDAFVFDYISKLIYNNNSKITILDSNGLTNDNEKINSVINSLKHDYEENITVVTENNLTAGFLAQQNLMMVSLDSWKKLLESQNVWLPTVPSVLILKQ